jgi:phosphate starvation-inducible protein PhoH
LARNSNGTPKAQKLERVDYGKPPSTLDPDGIFYDLRLNKEQIAFRDAIYDPDTRIVFCNSSAGTGKSVIAVGTAILMYHYRLYKGVTYIVAPYAEAKMGFLPGTVEEKVCAYLEPLRQAVLESNESPMHAIIQECPEDRKHGAFINAIAHSYLRGQTLSEQVVILEESQNYTEADLRKSLSRIKDDCKAIVIGHSEQIDLSNPSQSGFVRCLNHFASKGDPRVAVCELTRNYRGFISKTADEKWA